MVVIGRVFSEWEQTGEDGYSLRLQTGRTIKPGELNEWVKTQNAGVRDSVDAALHAASEAFKSDPDFVHYQTVKDALRSAKGQLAKRDEALAEAQSALDSAIRSGFDGVKESEKVNMIRNGFGLAEHRAKTLEKEIRRARDAASKAHQRYMESKRRELLADATGELSAYRERLLSEVFDVHAGPMSRLQVRCEHLKQGASVPPMPEPE